MHLHRIRLHAKWTIERIMPTLAAQSVRLHRSFGKPTGISEDDRIQLVMQLFCGRAMVSLNDVCLGMADFQVTAFDVAPHLEIRNRLIVEWIDEPPVDLSPDGTFPGSIALEILPIPPHVG